MRALALGLILALPLAGCGTDDQGGDGNGGGDGGGNGTHDLSAGGNPDGVINGPDGALPDGGIWVHDGAVLCFPATCQGKLYECGDCTDNDGDGKIDSEDPDCLGACQNN